MTSVRTNVSFRHPAEFVSLAESNNILAVDGACWFVTLLHRVPGLEIDENLCQEDWGTVIFAKRNGKAFWLGLSAWTDEGFWLAHIHHGSFAWLQAISPTGKKEMNRLVTDIYAVLTSEAAVSDIAWYEEKEMRKAEPESFPTPN
jgi:hypothetical protein